MEGKVFIQFASMLEDEEQPNTDVQISVPVGSTVGQLELILNKLLQNEALLKYGLFVEDNEIINDLEETLRNNSISTEQTITIRYTPKQLFNVKPVTRNSASLSG